MIFVAGGTGFAPIKAIIEHALLPQARRARWCCTGARARWRDLYLPRAAGTSGRRSTRISRSCPCCPNRGPRTHGAAARASSTRRCWTISRTCRATRSTPAADPRWSTPRAGEFTQQCGLPDDEFFADSFTYAARDGGRTAERGSRALPAGVLEFGQRQLQRRGEMRVRLVVASRAAPAVRPAPHACANGRRARGSPRSTSAPCPTATRARTACPARRAAPHPGCAHEPALGRLELPRRSGVRHLRVQHREIRVPVALEAARDDLRRLAIAAEREEARRAGARDLRIHAVRIREAVPVGAQARGVVAKRASAPPHARWRAAGRPAPAS